MILQSLAGYYDRLAGESPSPVPLFGYWDQKISFALVLDSSGVLAGISDLRDTSGKRPRPVVRTVPRPPSFKRTVKVLANYLWDKSDYVLGVGRASEPKGAVVDTPERHSAFRSLHERLLAGTSDRGLVALLRFLATLDKWHPESVALGDQVIGENLVFRLDGDRQLLHERPAARAIWDAYVGSASTDECVCLVSGLPGQLARLHPEVKGVEDAQSSGATLVSFNAAAFTSYGKEQGANAPVSERSAFAYTAALSYLLQQTHRHSVVIGDATTVFWAEAGDRRSAEVAETLFRAVLGARTDESESARIRPILEGLSRGLALADVEPELDAGTQFFVLGLAPNKSRLSVRYWCVGTIGTLAARVREHLRDIAIEPAPWQTLPSVWRLVLETAPTARTWRERVANVPPLLAGETLRAILTGERYPRTLLTELIMRCRAEPQSGKGSDGIRAALIKACLIRNDRKTMTRESVPVSLDPDEANAGYRLGRLFAILEGVQRMAVSANATIRDRYYGAASATPAGVFPLLLRTTGHHLSKLRKDGRSRLAVWFERQMGEIIDGLGSTFPPVMSIDDQGRFAIGYYQQRYHRSKETPTVLAAIETEDTEDTSADEEE